MVRDQSLHFSCKLVVVERMDIKPCCDLLIKLCWWRYTRRSALIILSISLQAMLVTNWTVIGNLRDEPDLKIGATCAIRHMLITEEVDTLVLPCSISQSHCNAAGLIGGGNHHMVGNYFLVAGTQWCWCRCVEVFDRASIWVSILTSVWLEVIFHLILLSE